MRTSLNVQEIDGGVHFKIKVQPRAAKNEVKGLQDDVLKIRLTAPPVEGQANEACIKFIAKWLGISPKRVKIFSGQMSQQKIIRIEGLNKEEFFRLIERVNSRLQK